ncbi:chorismate mutase [Candidatus Gracilibacteria bacterium]|nr:chorismate mutase [Candidatus Gracilibacteria bacterium]
MSFTPFLFVCECRSGLALAARNTRGAQQCPTGVGGSRATTCEENTREAILAATREMVQMLITANGLRPEDIASAIFTTTPDLNAEFPAVAARELGWLDTALLCGHEMAVPGALPYCIRVLVHWNTSCRADEVVHVYIRGATNLRPERAVITAFQMTE